MRNLAATALACAVGGAAACASSGSHGFAPSGDDAGGVDASSFHDTGSSDAVVDATGDAPLEAGGDAGNGVDGAAFTAPTDMRDRIGVYAWGFDTTSWPGTPDRLNWAANKVAALGARTVRVYLGSEDIYGVLPPADAGPFDLATAATSTAYRTLFSSPSFDTYVLTTYSESDDASDWTTGYTAAQVAAERQAIAQLGSALLSTFPGKTFLLLDWEGDNAIAPVASSQAAWDGFVAWTNARAAGVVDARSATTATTSRLYSGVEFNLLRNLSTQAPCDTTANKCVISVVVPAVDVDYYSYSSWQSLGPDQTPAEVVTGLQADLTTALGWAKKHDASTSPARFLVGEFGAPREETDLGECAAMERTASVIGAIAQWGASYGIFWQIIDNTPPTQPNDFVDGFGLYKASGAASLSAGLFQTLYQTQVSTPPTPPSCPTISQGGVVDGVHYQANDINASTTLAIFGADFSATGDVVHVRQTGMQWDIAAGSPFFYTSASQINATLPGVFGGQNALVYVTDGNGVDANGQIVAVQP
jgi:hypothetical protein